MADDVLVHNPLPVGTDDSYTVSADASAGNKKLQRVKLAYSADASEEHVPADVDGLLVNLGANNDVTVTGEVELGATSLAALESVTAAGPLTDAQLRATSVPVDGPLTDTELRAAAVVVDGSGVTQPISGTVTVTEPVSVDDNGASLTVDGTVELGATTLAALETINASGPLTDAQLRATPVSVSGTVAATLSEPISVDDNGGSITVDGTFWQATQPVSAAALPLPSGAATSAKQDTIIGHVDGVETLLTTLAGTVSGSELQVDIVSGGTGGGSVDGTVAHGTAHADDPVKIGGVAVDYESMPADVDIGDRVNAAYTPKGIAGVALFSPINSAPIETLPVSVDNLVLDAGDNNIGNVDIVTMPDVVVVGDIAHDSPNGGNPVKVGGHAYSGAPTAVTDGDITDAAYTTRGALHVFLADVNGSKIHYVEQQNLGADNANGILGLGRRDDALSTLTADEGEAAGIRLNSVGAQWVAVNGTVTTDGSGVTQPISHAALTELAAAIDTELQVDIVGALPTGDNTVGRVKLTDGTDVADVLDLTNSNPLTVAIVDGTGDQITSFGGGTQYTEGDTDASITGTAMLWEDGSDILRAVSAAKPLPIGDAGGSLTVDGTVTANAGTNLNTSALALEAGGNLAAAATSLGVLDNAISGSEMQVDVVAALPAGTNNIGDVDVLTFPSVSTATLTNVNDTASSTQLLASNSARKGCLMWNNSSQDLFIKYGTTASLTDCTVKIPADAQWEMPNPIYTGRIDGIWRADNSGAVRITEL